MNEDYIEQKEYELQQIRKQQSMEELLLDRLNEGLLDGLIGSGFNKGTLTSQALIKDGRPMLVEYLTEKGPIGDALVINKDFFTQNT